MFLGGLVAVHRLDAAQERKALRNQGGIPARGHRQVLVEDLALRLAEHREVAGRGEVIESSLSAGLSLCLAMVLECAIEVLKTDSPYAHL